VIDANDATVTAGVGTGIVFGTAARPQLEAGLRRTAALWRDGEAWRTVQRNGMAATVGWERSAKALCRAVSLSRYGLAPGLDAGTGWR
jgi:starch synthase